VKPEQVGARPIQCFGLLAPHRQEPGAVRYTLLPAIFRDMIRRPQLENAEGLPVALRLRQLDNLNRAAGRPD
jgi:hypothetical protein